MNDIDLPTKILMNDYLSMYVIFLALFIESSKQPSV